MENSFSHSILSNFAYLLFLLFNGGTFYFVEVSEGPIAIGGQSCAEGSSMKGQMRLLAQVLCGPVVFACSGLVHQPTKHFKQNVKFQTISGFVSLLFFDLSNLV